MKNNIVFGTLTAIAANEEEYKNIQKVLMSKGILFSSSVGTEENEKSPEEIKLEAEHNQLTGQKRFRLGKEQKALVDAGEKTRLDFLKAEVSALKKAKAKEEKAAAKPADSPRAKKVKKEKAQEESSENQEVAVA